MIPRFEPEVPQDILKPMPASSLAQDRILEVNKEFERSMGLVDNRDTALLERYPDLLEYEDLHWGFMDYATEFLKGLPKEAGELGSELGWAKFAETIIMPDEKKNFKGQFADAFKASINLYGKHLAFFPDGFIWIPMKRAMGEEKFNEWVWRNSLKINIDMDEAANNPVTAFGLGIAQNLPFAKHLVQWTGGGSAEMEKSIPYYLGAVTEGLAELILLTKAFKKLGTFKGLTAPTLKIPTKGFHPLIVEQIFSKFGKDYTTLGKLGKIGYRLTENMVNAYPMAVTYGFRTWWNKTDERLLNDKDWTVDDFTDIVKSMALGQGMATIGNFFAGRGVSGIFPHIKARASEETLQMLLGAGFTLSELYKEKGHLTAADLSSSILYEMMELGPELLLPAGMALIGKSHTVGDPQSTKEAQARIDETIRNMLTFRRPDLKGDIGASNKYMEDFKIAHEKFKEDNPDAGLKEYNKWLKRYEIEHDKVLIDHLQLLNSAPEVSDDISIEMEELIRSPERLAILHDVAHNLGKFEDITPEDLQSQVMYYTEIAGEKSPLQKPIFTDVSTIYDNIWEDVTIAAKEGLEFASKEEVEAYKDKLRKYGIPNKIDDGELDVAFLKDMGVYRSIKAKEIKDTKEMTDVELEKAHRRMTERAMGYDISLENMPKRVLKGLNREMTKLEKLQEDAPLLAYVERMGLLRPEKVNALENFTSTIRDEWMGKPDLFSRTGCFDLLAKSKVAENEAVTEYYQHKDIFLEKIRPFLRKGWHVKGNEKIIDLVHKYLMTDDSYTLKDLQRGLSELGNYIDMKNLTKYTDSYKKWIEHDLARAFDIPYGRLVHNYFPLMRKFKKTKNITQMKKILTEDVHKRPRKSGWNGYPRWVVEGDNVKGHSVDDLPIDIEFVTKLKDNGYKNIGDVFDATAQDIQVKLNIPEKDAKSIHAWADDYVNLGDTRYAMGAKDFMRYISRSMRTKHFKSIVNEYNTRIADIEADFEKAGKPHSRVIKVMREHVASLRGIPTEVEQDFRNWIDDLDIVKMTGTNQETVNRYFDLGMSAIYSGGLGLRFPPIVRQLLQGPLLQPPGLHTDIWFKGMYLQLRHPAYRIDASRHGIYKSTGLGGFSNRAMENIKNNPTGWMLWGYTAGDRYWNRGPMYIGSKYTFNQTFVNKGAEGIRNLIRGMPEGARARVMESAMQLEKDFNRNKVIDLNRLDDISHQFSFWNQACSNWEYGQFGRPHFMESHIGRTASMFMTWQYNYWGFYIPYMIRADVENVKNGGIPFGILEHAAKCIAVGLLLRKLGMKWQNTVPPTSATPSGLLAPIPGSINYGLKYLSAKNYGDPHWEAEALDDFKRSLKIFQPGRLGIVDMMDFMETLKRDIPYMDSKGTMVTETPTREAWVDLFGSPTMKEDLIKATYLWEQGYTEEAMYLYSKWGRIPYQEYKSPGGFSAPGGFGEY